jgi:predicted acetyltransferase
MSNTLSVCKPSLDRLEVYAGFVKEYLADDQSYFTMLFDMHEETQGDMEKIISLQIGQEKGEFLPAGWVPVTTLWLEQDEKIVGQAAIRHALNCPVLEEFAGHVTYYILPSCRKRGYAKFFLERIIGEARMIGIKELRLYCDEENIASRKILEASHARLIDILDNRETWGEMTRRYSLVIG